MEELQRRHQREYERFFVEHGLMPRQSSHRRPSISAERLSPLQVHPNTYGLLPYPNEHHQDHHYAPAQQLYCIVSFTKKLAVSIF